MKSEKLKNVDAVYPLTPMQEGLLFDTLYAPGSGVHVMQYRWRAAGQDMAALRRAWSAVIARHQLLRACVVASGVDKPLQVVRSRVTLPWTALDWSDVAPAEAAERLEELCQRDRRKGFDLAQAPLMRMTVVRTGDGSDHFIWSFHHLILDGWSVMLLLAEVAALHEAFARGEEPRASPAPRFGDYVAWLAKQDRAATERFWRDELRGFSEPVALWSERVRSGTPETTSFSTEPLRLSAEVSRDLARAARQCRVTVNTIVQGCFALALARFGGRDEIVFGATVAGRPEELPGAEEMLGVFINTVPLRVRMEEGRRLDDWLRDLQGRQPEIRQHAYAPLTQIASWSEIARGARLFDAVLVFQNVPAAGGAPAEGAGGEGGILQMRTERINFPLTMVIEPGAALSGQLMYDDSSVGASDARLLVRHLELLLRSAAASPGARLAELPALDPADAARVLGPLAGEARPYPRGATLPELFAAQVAARPDAPCLAYPDGRMTYAEVDRRSDRIAARLRALGVGPEARVGVALERSCNLVIAMLAVVKAGGAYVPLDLDYPDARLAFMLADCAVNIAVTDGAGEAKLSARPVTLVRIDQELERLGAAPPLAPPRLAPESMAYVIYTSGSTGKPKGSAVHHRGIVRLVVGTECPALGPGDRVTQMSNPGFDAATFEIWGALLNGGCLVGVSKDVSLSPELLGALLREERVTTMFVTSALFHQLVRQDPRLFAGVREILVGGDVVDPTAVRLALREGPPARLMNAYGPTENTTFSTIYEIRDVRPDAARIPIGHAVANSTAYVVDRRGRPAPLGAPGEIWVGGDGVARGYVGRPELTAERFIPDPFSREPGARLYRTGDLGRMNERGAIEFLGRIDQQVKLRGFRIELGEIEAALQAQPAVREAVVVIREDRPGEKRLVAYVAADGDPAEELRASLRRTLPDHMVPAAFVVLPSLPVTPNGKVDRRALPAPAAAPAAPAGDGAPRGEVEAALCEIFAEVLHLDRVGIHDSFFELGGDSIISIQIVARAARRGLRVSPRQIFERRTVAELARSIGEAAPRAPAAREEAVQGAAPLTPIQRWFFEGEPAGSRHFNQHVLLAAGALDPALVRAAVAQLVEHHDQLRARFVRGEGGLQQIIEARTGDVPFAHVDLSHLPEERQREELSARAAAIQGGMDPEAGRVFQAAQLDLGAGRGCRLLLVSHHLVVDGVSWRILVEDLESLYEQLERGEAPKLPPKTTAFGRWAARLVERAGSAAMDEERDYWREGAAAAAAALPRDRAGGANTVESAQSITCSLGAAETGALLHDVPAAYRTEINDALLAALVRALERWTGSPRVRFDLEGHGREELFPDVDVTRTVGWFTTMFPVVVHLEGLSGAPGELLRAVKEQLRHVPRRGIGYGLLRYLCPDRAVVDRLAAAPRAEVAFNYLGQLDGLAGGGRFRVADEPAGAPHGPDGERSHLLSVNATVLGGQLHVTWEYSANVHDRSTIERVVADFTAALRAIIAHCRSPEAGGYTPSDFPLTGLTQAKIDQLFGNDRGVEDVYPLSPAQRGMLSHALFAPSELYFEQFRLRVGGQGAPFDPAACVRAWQDALERHPILRTSFRWAELDVPLQVVHRAARVPVTHIDLRGLPAPEQEAGIARALEEDRRRGFSLTEAPLLRVTLARTGDEAYEMLWSCHHLLLDGWSAALLLDELAAELAAASSGDRGAARPPRRRPYRDYIEWLARQPLDEAERFFRALLEGVKSPTPVWFDAAAHAAEDGFGEIELTLPDDVTARLRRLCQESELTLSTAVQGAWALLLGRRADRDDVVFGATVSGRPPQLEGVEAMLGLFINTLPLRVRIDDDEAVAAWLRGVQALGLRMRQHEHTPLLSVQQWSELPPGLRPFETLVVFENYPVAPAGGAGEGGAEASFFVGARTNYPLTLLVGPGARLSLRIVYQKRFFEPSTVARIGGELATILSAMSLDGGAKVGSLPVLTAEEQGLLASWNQTGHAPSDDDTLLGRLRAGGIGGAAFLDREVTAGELAASSALLAGRLADAGVLPGAVVAVALRDPIERIVASLAALRAGASFVVPEAAAGGGALDLGGAEVAATVTDPREGSGERWQIVGAQPGGHGSAAAAGGAGLDAVACHVRAPRQGGGAPAWVPLTHRALASYLAKLRAALRVGADDVLVCSELASAETAGLDVLLPLAAGARALVLSAAECGDREALTARIEASHATLLALPPDCFQGLLEQAWARAAGVRVLCARGLLPTELVMHLLRSGAEVWRIDVGHPAALWAKAVDAEFTRGVRYVGAPMTNGRAVVRDRRGRALPIGTIGELHVGDARGGAPPACADAPTGLAARALDTGDIELVHELARSRAALRPRPASSVEYIAPRDTVEFRLALALEELLQVHPIGIRDDFFALGGNSLLGLHLVAWIQRELGVHVPLAVLVEASTIEGLSDVLRRRGEGAARSPIVKIQPGGHLSPFFFVHPIGGNVLCYVDLARLMGADQPVYGLQAQGTDALDPRPPRIETMAAEYVDAVRRVQPRGPYLLGGLSFGGYVAFEMAQELHRRGEEVGMVALLDTWGPYYNESEEFAQDLIDATIIYGLASEFARSYGKSLQLSLDVLKRLGPEEQLTHVLSEMRAVNLLPRDSELSQMRRSLQWYRSNSRALRDYRPTVYDGQITLFRASEIDSRQHYIRYHPVKGDPTLGWGRLSTRSVELHDVPGTHTTMILDPMNLRGLAAKLRAALDQVHARIPRGDLQSAQAPSSGGALPEEVRR